MATYTARMMSADGNGEGVYTFDADDKLMKKPADEIVQVFFDYVDQKVLKQHVDWELNGAIKNKELNVVTAMGSLEIEEGQPSLPFLLMIANA